MQDHSISEDDNFDDLCGDDENENASTEIQDYLKDGKCKTSSF